MDTTGLARSLLHELQNVSHDDLDDRYAGHCDCGGKLRYIRETEDGTLIPRGERPLECVADNCTWDPVEDAKGMPR